MNQFLHLAYLLLIIGLLSACSDSSKSMTADEFLAEQEAREQAAEAIKRALPPTPESLWPKEIRHEVYGDPETFSTPRILFKGMYGSTRTRYLWSMRLDGSDRRMVAGPDLFYHATISHTSIRSPNNRYIALSLSATDGFFRAIIDLKTKTTTRIMDGGGRPHFNWTEDSDNLIFYSDGEHMNYQLSKKTLTKRKPIYSRGLFLLPGGNRFLAMKSDGYWLHNFDGDIIKEVKFGFASNWNIKNPVVSPDGKTLVVGTDGHLGPNFHWFDVSSGKHLGSEDRERFLGATYLVIFSDKDHLHFRHDDSIRSVNLKTKEITDSPMKEIYIWKLTALNQRSLYNYHGKLNLTQGGNNELNEQ